MGGGWNKVRVVQTRWSFQTPHCLSPVCGRTCMCTCVSMPLTSVSGLGWTCLSTCAPDNTALYSIAVEDLLDIYICLTLKLNHTKSKCWHVKCLECAATKHAVCDNMHAWSTSIAQADHINQTLYRHAWIHYGHTHSNTIISRAKCYIGPVCPRPLMLVRSIGTHACMFAHTNTYSNIFRCIYIIIYREKWSDYENPVDI